MELASQNITNCLDARVMFTVVACEMLVEAPAFNAVGKMLSDLLTNPHPLHPLTAKHCQAEGDSELVKVHIQCID